MKYCPKLCTKLIIYWLIQIPVGSISVVCDTLSSHRKAGGGMVMAGFVFVWVGVTLCHFRKGFTNVWDVGGGCVYKNKHKQKKCLPYINWYYK